MPLLLWGMPSQSNNLKLFMFTISLSTSYLLAPSPKPYFSPSHSFLTIAPFMICEWGRGLVWGMSGGVRSPSPPRHYTMTQEEPTSKLVQPSRQAKTKDANIRYTAWSCYSQPHSKLVRVDLSFLPLLMKFLDRTCFSGSAFISLLLWVS